MTILCDFRSKSWKNRPLLTNIETSPISEKSNYKPQIHFFWKENNTVYNIYRFQGPLIFLAQFTCLCIWKKNVFFTSPRPYWIMWPWPKVTRSSLITFFRKPRLFPTTPSWSLAYIFVHKGVIQLYLNYVKNSKNRPRNLGEKCSVLKGLKWR